MCRNSCLSLLGLLFIVNLTACSIQPPKSMMDVQPGEVFVLNTPITIAADHTKYFIQFGELSGSAFNQYEPHCRIELNDISDHPQKIVPDRFIIQRVAIDEEMIAFNPSARQFAFNSKFDNNQTNSMTDVPYTAIDIARSGDYQRPETMDLVHFYLHSAKQPNVMRLTCAGALSTGDPKDYPRNIRPRRAQIQQILGKVGRIENPR